MVGCALLAAFVGVIVAALAWIEAGFLWALFAYVLVGSIVLLSAGCYQFWVHSPGRTARPRVYERTSRAAPKIPVE